MVGQNFPAATSVRADALGLTKVPGAEQAASNCSDTKEIVNVASVVCPNRASRRELSNFVAVQHLQMGRDF